MAKYVIFIYNDEAQLGGAGPDTVQETLEGHQKFAAGHGQSLRGGGRLAPSASALSIRTGDDGAPAVSQSGAFIPGAAQRIGGYYIIEADDITQAADIARDVPAPFGGVEVRELI
jgi:hypothetical protein